MSQKNNSRMAWYTFAFIVFGGVWGFGNTINGFSTYGGLKAIIPWLIVFIVYFIPYALMVGELGSSFKNEEGGVSSWIKKTIGPTAAYFAGWTYWIVHMPYMSQKPSAAVVATSWVLFQDKRASEMNTMLMQAICLVIFIAALYFARKGIAVIRKLSSLAGSAMFAMCILYIILMFAAPMITNASLLDIEWSLETFMPTFDVKFFTSLSILVLAVGGCEKVSPYVNKVKDPSKDFARGMIALAVMVALCAVLGTVAMGMMFDSNNIPDDLMVNGAYYCFQMLGEYYGVGNLFVILYALTNLISQVSVLIISIDAPLCMLLGNADEKFIPKSLFKQNEYGAYVNGHKMIAVIVGLLIIIPAFGIDNVDVLMTWLIKLNSVCMPMRYLWVFVAYIALKKVADKYPSEYYFTKSKGFGMFMGAWCFAFTAFACIGGVYSEDTFQLVMNIATPVVFVILGFILPAVAKKQNNK